MGALRASGEGLYVAGLTSMASKAEKNLVVTFTIVKAAISCRVDKLRGQMFVVSPRTNTFRLDSGLQGLSP